MAAVGATTVLSFASVADYFPKELAGRATAALNVFHIGGAFLLQNLIGIIVNLWPGEGIQGPILAYQVAFGVDLAFQLAACIWFMWPRAEGKMSGSVRPFSVEAIAVKVHPLRA